MADEAAENMSEKPKFHFWDDATPRSKHALWLIPAGMVIYTWLRAPTFDMGKALFVFIGAAVFTFAGFGVIQKARREILSGEYTGEILLGSGPDGGEPVGVTHLRDELIHPFRCTCQLFHSEAEAERAGHPHTGERFPVGNFGFAGYPFVRVKVPGEDRYLPPGRDW